MAKRRKLRIKINKCLRKLLDELGTSDEEAERVLWSAELDVFPSGHDPELNFVMDYPDPFEQERIMNGPSARMRAAEKAASALERSQAANRRLSERLAESKDPKVQEALMKILAKNKAAQELLVLILACL